MVAKPTKRFKVTTDSKHNHTVAPNLFKRPFQVDRHDTVWASDVTYLWNPQGWLYVAAILDLFSRKVVGWSIDRHMISELVKKALNMAVMYRHLPKRLTLPFRPEKPIRQPCLSRRAKKAWYGVVYNMSRKGNRWDNAVVERFFRSLKTEQANHYRYVSREAARWDVVDYILMFYDSHRLHSTLGYRSPAVFEAEYQKRQNAA